MDFNEETGNLVITVTIDEVKTLKQWQADASNNPDKCFGSDDMMYEWFDDYLANTEYEWIAPEENGDLTDAPILGVYGDPERRWGFMDYAIDYVLGRLIEYGQVTFQAP